MIIRIENENGLGPFATSPFLKKRKFNNIYSKFYNRHVLTFPEPCNDGIPLILMRKYVCAFKTLGEFHSHVYNFKTLEMLLESGFKFYEIILGGNQYEDYYIGKRQIIYKQNEIRKTDISERIFEIYKSRYNGRK